MNKVLAAASALAVIVLLSACSPPGTDAVRSAEAAPTTASAAREATPLDGVYRWSTTAEQAVGTVVESDVEHVWSQDDWPSVPATFTMTLDRGAFSAKNTLTSLVVAGRYTVDDDVFEMVFDNPEGFSGDVFTMSYSVDDDGTLRVAELTPFADPGDAFVFTLNPWQRIG